MIYQPQPDTTGPVVIVTPRYAPAIGGVERHVTALARGLARRGYRIEVATTDPTGKLPALEERDGLLVRRFPTVANDAVFFVSPQLGLWLARNARRFALIHAHSYHTPLVFQAALAARRARVPLVLTPHYHGSGHSRLRRVLHVPYRPLGTWALRQAQLVICVSQTERVLLESHVGRLPAVVIPNGIDLPTPLAAHQPAVLPDASLSGRKLLLAVGRLEAYKQTDRLIAALPHLPPVYAAIVIGAGPLRPQLAELTSRLGLAERVRLLDHVSGAELRDWYAGAAAFVSLSQHEAFGLTVLEAAAAGAPVVASAIDAHREVAGFLPAGRVTFVAPTAAPAEVARAAGQAVMQGRSNDTGEWQLPTWEAMAAAVAERYTDCRL